MNPDFQFRRLPPNFNPRAPIPNNAAPPPYVIPDRGYQWRSTRSWHLSGDFFDQNRNHHAHWWLFQPNWGNARAWAGRQPGFFARRNSFFTPYGLILKARREDPPAHLREIGYEDFSTSFVRSRKAFSYGYCEIACKLGDSTISSAFWLKEVPKWVPPGRKVGKREREIDIFEYSTSTMVPGWNPGRVPFSHMFHMNTHWYHDYGQNEKKGQDNTMERYADCGQDLSTQVLKVGIYWGRDRICWYLNDQLVREERANDWSQPFTRNKHFQQFTGNSPPRMHIQFDRETMEGFFGLPDDNDNLHKPEGDFRVLYCRTWEMEPVGGRVGARGFRHLAIPRGRLFSKTKPEENDHTQRDLKGETPLSRFSSESRASVASRKGSVLKFQDTLSQKKQQNESSQSSAKPKQKSFGNGWMM